MKSKKINKKEIISKLEERKDKLKKRGVKKIGLFGSFARGEQKRGSDIDFLLEINDEDIAENYFELLFYLENLFKRKIDLIPIQNLRKELNYVKKEAEYVII